MESDLLGRARNGNADDFARLMSAYILDVRRILRSLTGSGDTEDLEQEVLIAVFLGLGRYQGGSAFSTWLYRLCRNKAADHIRRERRRRALDRLLRREAPIQSVSAGERLDPQRNQERAELAERYEAALGRLKTRDRAILTLKDREGATLEKIALLFGLPVGTVKSRLHRARAAVLSLLEDEHGS